MRRLSQFTHAGSDAADSRRITGVYVGVVTNNQDPDGLGRVKVRLPAITDDHESNWCRVCTPMAGNAWGMQFIPEVNDEVLVAFEQGDVNHPYVLGSLYNGMDKPALDNGDGKNNIRQIKSRSGHLIILDDTEGSEKITIRDRSESQEIVFDAARSALTVKCGGNVELAADGNFEIKTQGNFKIAATGNIEIKASGTLKAEAAATADLKAGATLNVRGAQINLN